MTTDSQTQNSVEPSNQVSGTGTSPVGVSSTSEGDQTSGSVILSEVQGNGTESKNLPGGDPSTSSGGPRDNQPATDNQQPTTDNGQPKQDDGIMTKSERDGIWDDLKKSFKDLGRIPYLLILPLLNLIQSQYEKIPEDRRKGLARMSADIKASGKDGIQKIKDWWSKKDDKKEEAKDGQNKSDTPPNGQPINDNSQSQSGTPTPTIEKSSEIATNQASASGQETAPEKSPDLIENNQQTNNGQSPSPAPISTTINVETETGKQIKVTTTIEPETQKTTPN